MKTFIVLLLSYASAFGADGATKAVTVSKTNAETASITTKDFYTRDGQTNLVRHTKTKDGVVQIRIHRFYHAGALVADYMVMPDSAFLSTEAGTPYSVGLECDKSRNPKSIVISTKDGTLLDAFTYTNGIFSPLEISLITNANTVGEEVRGVMEELSERRKKK